MTDEEKLRDYLRQNAPKPEGDAPKPEAPAQGKSLAKETHTSWYKGQVWGVFRWVSIFITFFVGVIFAYLNSEWGLETERAVTIGGSLWATGIFIISAITIYRLSRYSKWVNSGYYKLMGWDEFFTKRTSDFWNQRNYTNVRISFNLAPEASELHRQVLKTFTNMMVEKWGKRYQHKDYEWIGGAPKDLGTNGTSLYGEFSQGELMKIVKILVPQFVPVAKMLGTNLHDVVIKCDNKERHQEQRPEKDDPSENQRQWESINNYGKD
jgi:hypothetical protein